MAAIYQAENWIDFRYYYIDQDKVPINISTASTVTLYLYLPIRTTKTVSGLYVVSPNQNLVHAVAKTIVNSDLGASLSKEIKTFEWQFKVVLLADSEPIWSPRFSIQMKQNLDKNLG